MLRVPRVFSVSSVKRRFFSVSKALRQTDTSPSPEFFEHTSARWLYNEAPQKEIRRITFDVNELIRVACAALGTDTCLSVHKIGEGAFNKIFRLRFSDSRSLIARLPSSRLFGNGVSWAIASEVATMHLMRECDVKTPRIFSWGKDFENPVGSPYILMEDVDGVSLSGEWLQPEMRGDPVVSLLLNTINSMVRMTSFSFPKLGSLYFRPDVHTLPQSDEKPSKLSDIFYVGPISDPLWWRNYHDEPHLDRGPWNTAEEYIKAAVRLERRAVERHRADPSSLRYTGSSIDDLSQIERLLDKVDALAPQVQAVIERASPFPQRFMQNCLIHPDISSSNIMVPKLTAENSVARMEKPIFIDWQATSVLPFALQWYLPPLVEYQPKLLKYDGEPVLNVNVHGTQEIPWPDYFEELSSEEQEIVRAEHRLATRNIRWNECITSRLEYLFLMDFRMRMYFRMTIECVLRACADGPHALETSLMFIKDEWDSDAELLKALGPCPYSFEPEEVRRYKEVAERQNRFSVACTMLCAEVECTRDGAVADSDYETAARKVDHARREWDEETCGGPFPFDDGRWSEFLR